MFAAAHYVGGSKAAEHSYIAMSLVANTARAMAATAVPPTEQHRTLIRRIAACMAAQDMPLCLVANAVVQRAFVQAVPTHRPTWEAFWAIVLTLRKSASVHGTSRGLADAGAGVRSHHGLAFETADARKLESLFEPLREAPEPSAAPLRTCHDETEVASAMVALSRGASPKSDAGSTDAPPTPPLTAAPVLCTLPSVLGHRDVAAPPTPVILFPGSGSQASTPAPAAVVVDDDETETEPSEWEEEAAAPGSVRGDTGDVAAAPIVPGARVATPEPPPASRPLPAHHHPAMILSSMRALPDRDTRVHRRSTSPSPVTTMGVGQKRPASPPGDMPPRRRRRLRRTNSRDTEQTTDTCDRSDACDGSDVHMPAEKEKPRWRASPSTQRARAVRASRAVPTKRVRGTKLMPRAGPPLRKRGPVKLDAARLLVVMTATAAARRSAAAEVDGSFDHVRYQCAVCGVETVAEISVEVASSVPRPPKPGASVWCSFQMERGQPNCLYHGTIVKAAPKEGYIVSFDATFKGGPRERWCMGLAPDDYWVFWVMSDTLDWLVLDGGGCDAHMPARKRKYIRSITGASGV